jgi:hypothetical protein
VRIATWNLEWAPPAGRRGRAARRYLETVGADVIVTTEDHLRGWDRYRYVVDGGADWGYPVNGTRRKVIAWSTSPWTDVHTVDHGAALGRFVAADTTIGDVTATVVAVCIPWAAAHVSTGRRDRRRWDEHVEFCGALGEFIAGASGHVVVAGDFNQTIPRRRQPAHVHDALIDVLDGYDIVSAGDTPAGPLIDHIAVGSAFTATEVTVWPNVIDDLRLSDHAGVAVTIERHVT